MEFDYKTLVFLRKNTTLDPISYFKVVKERNVAIKTQKIMNNTEHCDAGIDFTEADQLEAELRYQKWRLKVVGAWIDDYRSIDFEEFAWNALEIKRDKQLTLKK